METHKKEIKRKTGEKKKKKRGRGSIIRVK